MWLEIPDEFIKKSLMALGAQDRVFKTEGRVIK
jgi:hypothetical protein